MSFAAWLASGCLLHSCRDNCDRRLVVANGSLSTGLGNKQLSHKLLKERVLWWTVSPKERIRSPLMELVTKLCSASRILCSRVIEIHYFLAETLWLWPLAQAEFRISLIKIMKHLLGCSLIRGLHSICIRNMAERRRGAPRIMQHNIIVTLINDLQNNKAPQKRFPLFANQPQSPAHPSSSSSRKGRQSKGFPLQTQS